MVSRCWVPRNPGTNVPRAEMTRRLSPINLSTYHSETGPGLIALALFFVRFLLVWLLGLASGWLSLPLDSRLQKLRGSGLDRVLQAHARLAPTLTFWS